MDSFHFLDLLCLATLDSDIAEALQIKQKVTVAAQVLPLCQVLLCEMKNKNHNSFDYFGNVMPKFMHCNVYSNSAHELLCTQINVKLIDYDCVWIRYAIEGHFMFICLKLLPSTLAEWWCVN